MMRKLVLLGLAVAVVALAGVPLVAAPLQKDDIAAGAKWAAHLDLEGFLASKVGTFADQEIKKKPQAAAGLQVLQNLTGMDLTKDLKSATLYGTDFGEDSAVVLVRGKFDQAKLLALIKANPSYKELKYGDYVVHQWTDKPNEEQKEAGKAGPTKYGAFHKDNAVIVTQNFDRLKLALDVLDRKADSLARDGGSKLVLPSSSGAFVTAAATDLASAATADKPGNGFMKRLAGATFEVGESDNKFFVRLTVTAKSAQVANDLRRIADGVLGVFDLLQGGGAEADQPMLPLPPEAMTALTHAGAILKDTTVTSQGETARLDVSTTVDNVIALLQAMIKQQEAQEKGAAEAVPSGELKLNIKE